MALRFEMDDGRPTDSLGAIDAARVWKEINDLMRASADSLVESLRVAVYCLLQRREKLAPLHGLRQWGAILRSFCHPLHVEVPRVLENRPVILFPYSTGSNLLNLMPVAHEAARRGLVGGIVAGEADPGPLRSLAPVVSERMLGCLAGLRCLPSLAKEARWAYGRLLSLLEEHAPIYVARVRLQRSWLIRQLIWSRRMEIGYRHLFELWRPSCVVSTSDYWPAEFQFFCQARRLGIPNAMLQHGEFTSPLAWPVYAETFLVWGDIFREKLLSLGADAERIRVCGMPASDKLFLQSEGIAAKGIDPGCVRCLIFSHTHDRFEEPQLFDEFRTFLEEVSAAMPRVHWIVKLHPAEDDSFYRECSWGSGGNVKVLPRHVSLEEAVETCDVACTIRSTAGLQAMMMQRPVIINVLPSVGPSALRWPANGGGLYARSTREFTAHLDRLAKDPAFQNSVLKSQGEFLERTFANRGSAAAAVVDYLQEHTFGRNRQTAVA